jgi:hypothetical protein
MKLQSPLDLGIRHKHDRGAAAHGFDRKILDSASRFRPKPLALAAKRQR